MKTELVRRNQTIYMKADADMLAKMKKAIRKLDPSASFKVSETIKKYSVVYGDAYVLWIVTRLPRDILINQFVYNKVPAYWY